MASDLRYDARADAPVAPGESIREILQNRAISQVDFAVRLGKSEKFVSQLINGKATLSHESAIELERVLGVPASFWNAAEALYRDTLARQRRDAEYLEQTEWAKSFPLKAMRDNEWIARETGPAETVDGVLRYFGVSSPEAWESYWSSSKRLATRMSLASPADAKALTVWLRAGEIAAQNVETAPFDASTFREALADLRHATVEEASAWPARLGYACAAAGVAVVFVREVPRTRCYAVSWWAAPDKAVIELCLRGKKDDQFWFNFFHEAGHLLLHDRRRAHIHDLDGDPLTEQEANAFARDLLLPKASWDDFVADRRFSHQRIVEFAAQQGIAPGIVVGRLQKEKLVPHSHFNDLKVAIEWGK